MSVSADFVTIAVARGRDPGTDASDFVEIIGGSAVRRPHHPAVVGPDATLSYAELDRLSNQLARRFIAAGVGRDSCVGISLPRGAGELVAMLATSKAGGAYVPLDPSHPIDRLQLVLEDAAPQVMVIHPGSPLAGANKTANVIVLDDLGHLTEGYDATPPLVAYDPAQLAYVLFTSGSTGRPKGVEVPRGAFSNFLRSMAHEPGFSESERLLAVSTTSFDIAGLELFLPLYAGATTVIADRATVMDPRLLRLRLEADDITFMQATPATWRLLLEAGWKGQAGLRMLCGGEALSSALADRLLASGGELWNMYGPTETTVWSSLQRIAPGTQRIGIGKPIDRTQIYALDEQRRPVPRDAIGELYIGGHGVARGYRGRPDLTAERFVQNPDGPAGDLIYRTGDLGRLSADGTFECLGRIDHQVKIRGYRIELGEIESVLRGVEGVREVLVVAEDQEGDPRLSAYWVGTAERDALVGAARRALPPYMVPASYVRLESFPLTPNGKIDRKSLPRGVTVAVQSPRLKRPSDDTETRLEAIWCQVLGVERVGVDQDFFTLGGTSVLAVQTCVQIEKETGVEISLASFFASPTIEGLAPYVTRAREVSSPNAPIIVDLRRSNTQRAPLFCLLGVSLYHELALALTEDRTVVGMHVPFRHVPGTDQRPTVAEMAAGYLALIRHRQAHGPYYLAGLCFGGIVAFEVARQLEAQGEEVGVVSVIDGALPLGMETNPLRNLAGYLRFALQRPESIGGALRKNLGKLRARWQQQPPPVSVRSLGPVDVEIDGPEADAEVVRFASTVRGIRGRLLIVRALSQTLPSWRVHPPHLGWQGLSERLTICEVPASHLGLLKDPRVRVVAKAVAEAMATDEAARAQLDAREAASG
jgi:amino acid adenylation domain-containing protein